ncbi:MAG: hypothetical protein IBJ03_17635 [Gemmatimonadaceae bacterium]|nr:hypothetical protein [Gemmatimonadaceae bacterium]
MSETRNERLASLAAVLLALSAFLLMRPYEGIVHDARLYVGYALAPLDPAGIGQDIMFTLDGQGGKTLYPAMMRWFAQAIGLTPALVTLTYGALVLWFAAAWGLVRAVAPRSLSSGGIAAVIVLLGSLHTFYGGASTIRFAEPFAAPRALAEALGMLAIVQALGARWWRVCALIGVAAIVHPIMTAPVIAVIVMIAASNDRVRGVLLGGGLTLGIGIAAAAVLVSGDGMLLGRFDAVWLQILDHYHSLILLRHWSSIDLARVVLQLTSLAIARTCARADARPLVDGVILVGVAGLVLSGVGVDLLSHRLMGQAQPWRALWLVAVLSTVGIGLHAHHVGDGGSKEEADDQAQIRSKLSVILLASAWMLVSFTPAVVVVAVMAWGISRESNQLFGRFALRFPSIAPLALAGALGICVVGYYALQAVITLQVLGAAPAGAIPSRWLMAFRTGTPAALLCIGAILALITQRRLANGQRSIGTPPRPVNRAVLSLGIALFVVLLSDQRSTYERAMEAGLARSFSGVALPSQAETGPGPLAWSSGGLESWALFARPSWGTVNQGVAKVFSRSLAIQWAPRFEALVDSAVVPFEDAVHYRAQRRVLDLSHVERLCRMPDAPSTVVLPLPSDVDVPGTVIRLPATRFEPPEERGGTWRTIDSVRLVSCNAGSVVR